MLVRHDERPAGAIEQGLACGRDKKKCGIVIYRGNEHEQAANAVWGGGERGPGHSPEQTAGTGPTGVSTAVDRECYARLFIVNRPSDVRPIFVFVRQPFTRPV